MQKFGYPETLIKEYEHWVVLLKAKQTTVGTLVLVEKSEASHLGELSSESWAEFSDVTREIEGRLSAVFGAEKFNYLALMMKDPNVHFHLVPRYSKPVEIDGIHFIDTDWPMKTELGEIEMTNEQLQSIRTSLL